MSGRILNFFSKPILLGNRSPFLKECRIQGSGSGLASSGYRRQDSHATKIPYDTSKIPSALFSPAAKGTAGRGMEIDGGAHPSDGQIAGAILSGDLPGSRGVNSSAAAKRYDAQKLRLQLAMGRARRAIAGHELAGSHDDRSSDLVSKITRLCEWLDKIVSEDKHYRAAMNKDETKEKLLKASSALDQWRMEYIDSTSESFELFDEHLVQQYIERSRNYVHDAIDKKQLLGDSDDSQLYYDLIEEYLKCWTCELDGILPISISRIDRAFDRALWRVRQQHKGVRLPDGFHGLAAILLEYVIMRDEQSMDKVFLSKVEGGEAVRDADRIDFKGPSADIASRGTPVVYRTDIDNLISGGMQLAEALGLPIKDPQYAELFRRETGESLADFLNEGAFIKKPADAKGRGRVWDRLVLGCTDDIDHLSALLEANPPHGYDMGAWREIISSMRGAGEIEKLVEEARRYIPDKISDDQWIRYLKLLNDDGEIYRATSIPRLTDEIVARYPIYRFLRDCAAARGLDLSIHAFVAAINPVFRYVYERAEGGPIAFIAAGFMREVPVNRWGTRSVALMSAADLHLHKATRDKHVRGEVMRPRIETLEKMAKKFADDPTERDVPKEKEQDLFRFMAGLVRDWDLLRDEGAVRSASGTIHSHRRDIREDDQWIVLAEDRDQYVGKVDGAPNGSMIVAFNDAIAGRYTEMLKVCSRYLNGLQRLKASGCNLVVSVGGVIDRDGEQLDALIETGRNLAKSEGLKRWLITSPVRKLALSLNDEREIYSLLMEVRNYSRVVLRTISASGQVEWDGESIDYSLVHPFVSPDSNTSRYGVKIDDLQDIEDGDLVPTVLLRLNMAILQDRGDLVEADLSDMDRLSEEISPYWPHESGELKSLMKGLDDISRAAVRDDAMGYSIFRILKGRGVYSPGAGTSTRDEIKLDGSEARVQDLARRAAREYLEVKRDLLGSEDAGFDRRALIDIVEEIGMSEGAQDLFQRVMALARVTLEGQTARTPRPRSLPSPKPRSEQTADQEIAEIDQDVEISDPVHGAASDLGANSGDGASGEDEAAPESEAVDPLEIEALIAEINSTLAAVGACSSDLVAVRGRASELAGSPMVSRDDCVAISGGVSLLGDDVSKIRDRYSVIEDGLADIVMTTKRVGDSSPIDENGLLSLIINLEAEVVAAEQEVAGIGMVVEKRIKAIDAQDRLSLSMKTAGDQSRSLDKYLDDKYRNYIKITYRPLMHELSAIDEAFATQIDGSSDQIYDAYSQNLRSLDGISERIDSSKGRLRAFGGDPTVGAGNGHGERIRAASLALTELTASIADARGNGVPEELILAAVEGQKELKSIIDRAKDKPVQAYKALAELLGQIDLHRAEAESKLPLTPALVKKPALKIESLPLGNRVEEKDGVIYTFSDEARKGAQANDIQSLANLRDSSILVTRYGSSMIDSRNTKIISTCIEGDRSKPLQQKVYDIFGEEVMGLSEFEGLNLISPQSYTDVDDTNKSIAPLLRISRAIAILDGSDPISSRIAAELIRANHRATDLLHDLLATMSAVDSDDIRTPGKIVRGWALVHRSEINVALKQRDPGELFAEIPAGELAALARGGSICGSDWSEAGRLLERDLYVSALNAPYYLRVSTDNGSVFVSPDSAEKIKRLGKVDVGGDMAKVRKVYGAAADSPRSFADAKFKVKLLMDGRFKELQWLYIKFKESGRDGVDGFSAYLDTEANRFHALVLSQHLPKPFAQLEMEAVANYRRLFNDRLGMPEIDRVSAGAIEAMLLDKYPRDRDEYSRRLGDPIWRRALSMLALLHAVGRNTISIDLDEDRELVFQKVLEFYRYHRKSVIKNRRALYDSTGLLGADRMVPLVEDDPSIISDYPEAGLVDPEIRRIAASKEYESDPFCSCASRLMEHLPSCSGLLTILIEVSSIFTSDDREDFNRYFSPLIDGRLDDIEELRDDDKVEQYFTRMLHRYYGFRRDDIIRALQKDGMACRLTAVEDPWIAKAPFVAWKELSPVEAIAMFAPEFMAKADTDMLSDLFGDIVREVSHPVFMNIHSFAMNVPELSAPAYFMASVLSQGHLSDAEFQGMKEFFSGSDWRLSHAADHFKNLFIDMKSLMRMKKIMTVGANPKMMRAVNGLSASTMDGWLLSPFDTMVSDPAIVDDIVYAINGVAQLLGCRQSVEDILMAVDESGNLVERYIAEADRIDPDRSLSEDDRLRFDISFLISEREIVLAKVGDIFGLSDYKKISAVSPFDTPVDSLQSLDEMDRRLLVAEMADYIALDLGITSKYRENEDVDHAIKIVREIGVHDLKILRGGELAKVARVALLLDPDGDLFADMVRASVERVSYSAERVDGVVIEMIKYLLNIGPIIKDGYADFLNFCDKMSPAVAAALSELIFDVRKKSGRLGGARSAAKAMLSVVSELPERTEANREYQTKYRLRFAMDNAAILFLYNYVTSLEDGKKLYLNMLRYVMNLHKKKAPTSNEEAKDSIQFLARRRSEVAALMIEVKNRNR